MTGTGGKFCLESGTYAGRFTVFKAHAEPGRHYYRHLIVLAMSNVRMKRDEELSRTKWITRGQEVLDVQ